MYPGLVGTPMTPVSMFSSVIAKKRAASNQIGQRPCRRNTKMVTEITYNGEKPDYLKEFQLDDSASR